MEIKRDRSAPHLNNRDQWWEESSDLERFRERCDSGQIITIAGEEPGEYIRARTSRTDPLDDWMLEPPSHQPTIEELQHQLQELREENRKMRSRMEGMPNPDDFSPPDRQEVITFVGMLVIGGLLATVTSIYAATQGVLPNLVGWSIAGIFLSVFIVTLSIGLQLVE